MSHLIQLMQEGGITVASESLADAFTNDPLQDYSVRP